MYNDKLILESENKSKTVWKIINGSCIKNNISEIKLEINNTEIVDNKDICNTFNKYFKDVSKNLHISGNMSGATDGFQISEHTMFITPTDNKEVTNIIKQLKKGKSPGLDEVSATVIQNSLPYIIEPLTFVINESFAEGIFPNNLKKSKITPLYKKGSRKSMENYRPISLLSVFSKIFEKLMAIRLSKFLEKHNLLSENQFGFRESRSTEDAIIKLINFIYEAIDQRNEVFALFADLSKAFDCVDHKILLNKLEKMGVRGVALAWFKNYLLNRKQVVVVNGVMSEEINIETGVPQGSVLGPILFIVFINDLPLSVKRGILLLFADDSTYLLKCADLKLLIEYINYELDLISKWFVNNKLTLNKSKTTYIKFKPKQNQNVQDMKVTCDSTILNESQIVTYLGIPIDKNLSWDPCIDLLTNKISRTVFAMRRLKEVTSMIVLKTYYYAHFYSIVNYSVIFWGRAVSAERVFKMQKRLIRTMVGVARHISCKELFRQLEIMTVPCMYIYKIVCRTKKNFNSFKTLTNRNSHILEIPIHRLGIFEKSPKYNQIILFNKIPLEIKMHSFKLFKLKMREYLIKECFYSVEEYLNKNNCI